MGNKETINYMMGEHPDVPGRIVLAFDNTQLDLDNPEHKHFLDVLCKIVGSQMYAKANNIPMENVKYD